MKQKTNAAVQAYNLNKTIHDNCLNCASEINQPICPCCLAKSFKVWLNEHSHIENLIIDKLNNYLSHTSKYSGKICIRCNQKKVHTCPHCFTEFLHELIKENGAAVKTLSEFLFIFNFDFERKSYAHELEAYGGY